MRRFFVTGGAGFIGSAFVRLLLKEITSCEITSFDALTYAGNLDNLDGLGAGRHHFVKGDIADRYAVSYPLTSDSEASVTLHAESHDECSIDSADEVIRANLYGTL